MSILFDVRSGPVYILIMSRQEVSALAPTALVSFVQNFCDYMDPHNQQNRDFVCEVILPRLRVALRGHEIADVAYSWLAE